MFYVHACKLNCVTFGDSFCIYVHHFVCKMQVYMTFFRNYTMAHAHNHHAHCTYIHKCAPLTQGNTANKL